MSPAERRKPSWCKLEAVLGDIARDEKARVAFAISGGGATGAYQAGVIKAYLEATKPGTKYARLRPRIIVGTSAGALNAMCLLIETLRLEDQQVKASSGEPYVARLWKVIGDANRGADFVVGPRRAWLINLLTKWVKVWKRYFRTLRTAPALLGVVLLLLVLLALLRCLFVDGIRSLLARILGIESASTSEMILKCSWPVLFGLGILALVLYLLSRWFRRSIFPNEALRGTLANAVRGGEAGRDARARLAQRFTSSREVEAGRSVTLAWYEALEKGEAPDFILTATDLSTNGECLFTLVSPETFRKLAGERWQVTQIGLGLAPKGVKYAVHEALEEFCASTSESNLIRCIVASTSIPGVFPSQRIALHRFGDCRQADHDFVDGGVLNNAPVHVAIDANATHVISVELNPLTDPGPLSPGCDARGDEPRLLGNLVQTFETLLTLATGEDIRRAAKWNRLIDQEIVTTPKRIISFYRVAPLDRKVDTIEFNGHYDSTHTEPSMSLVRWMQQGHDEASAEPIFWEGTFESSPEEPPPVTRS